MIAVRRAAALAALACAACSGGDDPCAGAATCLRIDVESAASPPIARIDQLELDVVYGELHATATTQAPGGHTTELPLATAIALDLAGSDPVTVGVVAAGKLGATVLGTGSGSTSVAPHQHASISIALSPVGACNAGALYCGGDQLAGDPATLYQCNAGGVPIARGVCAGGCVVRPGKDDTCRASGGTCQDGGKYCGGDKLDGDPGALYTCMAGAGVSPVPCASGCAVRPGNDDACR